jgi:HEAT repeat protein
LLCAALFPLAGCQDWRRFWNKRDLAGDVKAMEDPVFPDERRSGVAGIQRRPELTQDIYQERFRQIARTDAHFAVRAQAARALNQGRDESAKPIFLVLLSDPEPRVRLEAAKALRHLPDERAVPRLLEIVGNENENRDVRIWSATALGRYPRSQVARALINLLPGRDFAVAAAARDSLRRMSGKDFHYDDALWLAWITSPNSTLQSAPATRP